MGTNTKISWTNKTWNPVTGCSKVSPGCAHCYAETLSMKPFMRAHGYTGLPWTPENAVANVQLHPERLEQPLHWRKPARVFVNSMSDLFHELIPFEFIDRVFAVMALTPQHTYQVLTKRPERMREYLTYPYRQIAIMLEAQEMVANGSAPRWADESAHWPLPNVWLGTSVENQHFADIRIPLLLETPAAVRFLSCEPLLGHLNILRYLEKQYPCMNCDGAFYDQPPARCLYCGGPVSDIPTGIDWCIVGGESGPGFRAMDLDWARSLLRQCQAAGTAYFFKQSSGLRSETGTELDGRLWHQFPDEVRASA